MTTEELPALDDLTQFHEERKAGLGSTDSAAILGVSPWKSAHDVWRDKVEDQPPHEPSLPMWLGLKLQEAVSELYSVNTNNEVEFDPALYTVGNGVVRAHVDCRWDLHDGYRSSKTKPLPESPIVELKTARSMRGWGPQRTDEVPRHYWIQVQHQMACLPEVQFAEIAVLFGHHEFRTYHIPRSQPFIESLIQDMEDWWAKYVITGTPPPVDGTGGSARWLQDQYPKDTTPVIPATPEQAALVQELQMLRETEAALLRAEELVVQKLKGVIGEAGGMYGPGWAITWKKNKESERIDWPLLVNDLRRMLSLDDETWEGMVKSRTNVREGARPFLLNMVDENNR